MFEGIVLKYREVSIRWLRISLGIVFFWFGILKVFGYNPVYHIVYSTYPMLASVQGNFLLGLLEAAIGVGLLINIFPKLLHVVLVAHLIGTFVTFISAPEMMFSPFFPVLTLEGEFVVKNITLVVAGIVVLLHENKK